MPRTKSEPKSKFKRSRKSKPSPKNVPILHLFGDGYESPLLWLLSADVRDADAENRISRWHAAIRASETSKKKKSKSLISADQLLREIDFSLSAPKKQSMTVGWTLQALAAAQAVRHLVDSNSTEKCQSLIQQLIAQSDRLTVEAERSQQSWLELLLAVELPLTLAYQLPEVVVSEDFGQPAADWMATSVSELLDDDGWPRADVLPIFGPLMACWVRSLKLIQKLKLDFSEPAVTQLEWAVRQLLRLTRVDQTLMFSGAESMGLQTKCLKMLLKLSDDRIDRKLAQSAIQNKKPKKLKRRDQLESSSISEWGESGILQSGWHCGSPKVCFDYSGQSFAIEVGAGTSLLDGIAFPRIKLDNVSSLPCDGFEIVCNHHDDDLDYVELQMEMRPALTLTRQIILARDENFLLIADCAVPLIPGKIDYQCDWPLATGISLMSESETCELYLHDPKIQALALPLSLPEWRVGRTSGRMEAVDRSLRVSQSARGAGIYVPLVFDLDPQRSRKKRTWRQLTVAEDRHPVANDVAAAFRFQLHKQQFIFYRIISEKGNRTFLGENFNGEFVFGRFDGKGVVSEMIRIE